MVQRIIKLPVKGSFFLFGPRQTGKTTLINSLLTKNIWKIDLLLSEPYLLYSKYPALFRKQAEEKIINEDVSVIFVDEIQRIPSLLTEIHYLIETYPTCRFFLTGSSARKLKRTGADLLAGRSVERHLFPYVYDEIKDGFKLDNIFRYGSLPALTGKNDDEKRDILQTYVHTYLREEIKAEGIARNLGGFSRFLDVAASQNGQLVNFSGISRECALPIRTVQSYYEILEDTLIGFRLEPWRKSLRKRLGSHPKFYLFDIGVLNAINRRLTAGIDPLTRGMLFEHFVILETQRLLDYFRSEASIYFWRTNTGAEVDLLIEKHGRILAACEIKSSSIIDGSHLSGLRSFAKEHPGTSLYIVATVENSYKIGDVKVMPWQTYLELLKTTLV